MSSGFLLALLNALINALPHIFENAVIIYNSIETVQNLNISLLHDLPYAEDLCTDVVCPDLGAPFCDPKTGKCSCGKINRCGNDEPICVIDSRGGYTCELCEFTTGEMMCGESLDFRPVHIGDFPDEYNCSKEAVDFNDTTVGVNYGDAYYPYHNNTCAVFPYNASVTFCAIHQRKNNTACFRPGRRGRPIGDSCSANKDGEYFCGFCELGAECIFNSSYTASDYGCGICTKQNGANSIPTKKEGQIDCGNGKRANSCEACKSTVINAKDWCGGDCEWDEFFELCDSKLSFDFSDGDDLDFYSILLC